MASIDQSLAGTSSSSISQPFPFFYRFKNWLLLWFVKLAVQMRLRTYRKNIPPERAPTYSKFYPVRPALECRVFVPKSYKAGDALLPLFIDIHGGGFALCDPAVDDGDNAILAHTHGICVVSIAYHKAPRSAFPNLGLDCAALIKAVLEDESLPVDKTKVAVGGYSAGGNLSLAATQLDGLNTRIKAVVAYYPVVNFLIQAEDKLKRSKLAPGKDKDMLSGLSAAFNWGYVPAGTDKRDPLLSPYYAKRSSLPEKLMFLGCEYDMLCPEAKDMAENLAKDESAERKEYDGDDSWEKGSIRWHLVKGTEHGFNSVPEKDPKLQAINKQKQKDMHATVAEWLFREVYA